MRGEVRYLLAYTPNGQVWGSEVRVFFLVLFFGGGVFVFFGRVFYGGLLFV